VKAGVELAASWRIRVWQSPHRQRISGGREGSPVAEIIADQVTRGLNCLYAVLADRLGKSNARSGDGRENSK
jgi:hypothetical protein